ncbi:UDP-N-acetylglucosamine 2-epimerase [Sporomusa silvacetica DSM 10669]|uniref:UDP-N-acetylglucosamine 2-epimerase n=1 Tax=Sporomusa silvacetica DSM 10669 TaxID=1123289 RepID=A0ABZ3IQS5_9FIRM|nr:UDP-N-acetylglucosamine 2-epimerase [Sporomusa silvacetica]OZC20546.1 UDP-N-acetylglucosamine 2-epimerase [Sporomusa silvacetica DSM 10669]
MDKRSVVKKKVLFLTGTRADFGKLKPLMKSVDESSLLECSIFVTGMHTMAKYGYTVQEVLDANFQHIHVFMNQIDGEPMDLVLSNTVGGLSRFVHESKPDMIVVHGDRIEALAGAIVGALNNILVAHIEGGEVSGTIDGLIRHSVSKLSHLHYVANEEAKNRLLQMGESPDAVFIIGSPDIDIMLSEKLPTLDEVKIRYEINFQKYGIILFHTVTTENDAIAKQANNLVSAAIKSNRDYIVIYPNNDAGNEYIFSAYERIRDNPKFRFFPSLRFEYFLTLLKHADFILGNSSSGIREAPVYAVPCINIGTRQQDRFTHEMIVNVNGDEEEILNAIRGLGSISTKQSSCYFGQGNSAQSFKTLLEEASVWNAPKQKRFCDLHYQTK